MDMNDKLDVPGKETPVLLSLEAGCALQSLEMLWREKKISSPSRDFTLHPVYSIPRPSNSAALLFHYEAKYSSQHFVLNHSSSVIFNSDWRKTP